MLNVQLNIKNCVLAPPWKYEICPSTGWGRTGFRPTSRGESFDFAQGRFVEPWTAGYALFWCSTQ